MLSICRLSGDTYKKWHDFIEKVKYLQFQSARKVYKKACKFCQDKLKIGQEWLEWEMLFGT